MSITGEKSGQQGRKLRDPTFHLHTGREEQEPKSQKSTPGKNTYKVMPPRGSIVSPDSAARGTRYGTV